VVNWELHRGEVLTVSPFDEDPAVVLDLLDGDVGRGAD
jgi:hypothetical protein